MCACVWGGKNGDSLTFKCLNFINQLEKMRYFHVHPEVRRKVHLLVLWLSRAYSRIRQIVIESSASSFIALAGIQYLSFDQRESLWLFYPDLLVVEVLECEGLLRANRF